MKSQFFRQIAMTAVLLSCSVMAVAQTARQLPSDAPLENAALVVARPQVQDIYLMIGQSNMGGRAAIGELDKEVLRDVYLFNRENHWEKAANVPAGMNRYSTVRSRISMQRLNPAYSFGRKLANYTGRHIGIVSNARGGTTVSWWQKGYSGANDFDMYEEAVARTKAALAASPKARLRGIIWHQGEGDNSSAKAAVYMDKLQKLVADLRTDLNAPDVPFIAGEVGTWKNRGRGVNPVIRQIAAHIPHSDFVSAAGLTSLNLPKNDPHFDTVSQRVLGERYADAILEMVYDLSPGAVTLFNQADFAGRSVRLKAGKYNAIDLEKRGILPQELAAIKIEQGVKVLLCTEKTGARPITYTADVNSLDISTENRLISLTVKRK